MSPPSDDPPPVEHRASCLHRWRCQRQLPCCQELTRPYANTKDSLQELSRSVNVACFAHTMLLLL